MYSGIADPLRWVLPEVLSEMAARRPGATWVADDDGQVLSFGEAESRSRRAASFFASLGVRRGDRVGMFLGNGCDFVVAWLGLGKLAATVEAQRAPTEP